MLKHLRAAALTVGIVALSAGAALAQEAPRGDAATGHRLYDSVGCYQCHGYVGQGGNAGPKLNPAPAWEPYLLQLRMPRQLMPPYAASVLSEQQAADILAYMQTFPKPPDPKTIRLLQ